MRYKKSYLIYLITLLSILCLLGCKATTPISDEKRKDVRRDIHLVEMKDGTLFQIHSGSDIVTSWSDEYLILEQVWGDTLAKIPVSELDFNDIYRTEYKKPSPVWKIIDAVTSIFL